MGYISKMFVPWDRIVPSHAEPCCGYTQVKKYGPIPAGKHWETVGTWKQYSGRKSPDFSWLIPTIP